MDICTYHIAQVTVVSTYSECARRDSCRTGLHDKLESQEPLSVRKAQYAGEKTPLYHVCLTWQEPTKPPVAKSSSADLVQVSVSYKVPESPEKKSSDVGTEGTEETTGKQNGGTSPIPAGPSIPAPVSSSSSLEEEASILLDRTDGAISELSLFRSKELEEVKEFYQACLTCRLLFQLLESVKDLKRLVDKVRAHPLWQAVHISARLGTTTFFSRFQAGEARLLKQLQTPSQPEGKLPLHIAVEHNNIDVVKLLLSLGVEASKVDVSNDANAFHFAAASASAAMVDVLCTSEDCLSVINSLNKEGYTPLFVAIRNTNPLVANALIQHGAELNIRCKGRSPLFQCLQDTNGPRVRQVVAAMMSSDPEMINEVDPVNGNTGLHAAAGKEALSALLLSAASPRDLINKKNNSGQTPVHTHAARNDIGAVMTIASYDADLNAADASKNTPLHFAASKGNLNLIRLLLVLGADPNPININKDSPRHLAAKLPASHTRTEIVKSLDLMGAVRCPPGKVGCRSLCTDRKRLGLGDDGQLSTASLLSVDGEAAAAETEDPVATAAEEHLDTRLLAWRQEKCITRVSSLVVRAPGSGTSSSCCRCDSEELGPDGSSALPTRKSGLSESLHRPEAPGSRGRRTAEHGLSSLRGRGSSCSRDGGPRRDGGGGALGHPPSGLETGKVHHKVPVAVVIVKSLDLMGAVRCPPGKVGCRSLCTDRKRLGLGDDGQLSTASLLSVDGEAAAAETEDPVATAAEEHLDTRLLAWRQEKCITRVRGLKKPAHMLSLDGGGIRGLVIVQILMGLERKLGEPVWPFFDWVAGTSTGSFIACSLARGKTLRECQHIYLRFKDQLFEGWSRPYNTPMLEALLKREMGEDNAIGDISRPRLIVTTTRADKHPMRLELFRSYQIPCFTDEENENAGYKDPKDMPLWRTMRCSSAAPTYFASVDNKYLDGGLVANNPACELINEVLVWNDAIGFKESSEEEIDMGLLMSIGTGKIPDVAIGNLDVELNISANPVQAISTMRNLGVMMVEQLTASEGTPVARSRTMAHSLGVPFFRFSAPMSEDLPLDTRDDASLVQLMWDSEVYVRRMEEELGTLAELLLSTRPPTAPKRPPPPKPCFH